MWSERVVSLVTKEDYIKSASSTLPYSETLGIKGFTYDEATKTVHVIKPVEQGSGLGTGFRIPITNMYKGDIVEVEYEYKKISGSQAQALVYLDTRVDYLMANSSENEWTKIKANFTLNKDSTSYNSLRYVEIGGYMTADGGQFKIRNGIVKFKSQKSFHVIEESGENENGSYIKYSDGTLICHGKRVFESVPITSASGVGFYSPVSVTPLGQYPVSFLETPEFLINGNTNGGYFWTATVSKGTTIDLPQINMFAFTSQTVTNVILNWQSIGKWK